MMTDTADTPAQMDGDFRRRLMAKSGLERLRMAADMFDTAVMLIVASLPAHVRADEATRRLAVLERMYGAKRQDGGIRVAIAAAKRSARHMSACARDDPDEAASG